MRRVSSVLLCILIGALAAGAGVYSFLYKANQDRERLASVALQAQEQSQTAIAQSAQTIEEANGKLAAANAEMSQAQLAIKKLQEERALILSATPLSAPSAKTLKTWKEALDIVLGVSLKFPPTSHVETNDEALLSLGRGATTSSDEASVKWLSITPYTQVSETQLLADLASSTPVTYLVDGHVLVGVEGSLENSTDNVFVLRAEAQGTSTHLIWAQDSAGDKAQTILSTLATLNFAP